jgi:hypothetical protein
MTSMARCKKTNTFRDKTCEDVYDHIAQEEYDYGLHNALAISSEESYDDKKFINDT